MVVMTINALIYNTIICTFLSYPGGAPIHYLVCWHPLVLYYVDTVVACSDRLKNALMI